jgi:hypothetical protein
MREHRHRVRRKGTCHVDVGGETVVVREVLDGDTEVSIVVSQPPFRIRPYSHDSVGAPVLSIRIAGATSPM